MTRALDWRLKAAGGLLIALAGAALLFLVDPRIAPLPRCPLHVLSGLHCPGCGSTRALHLLLHGDIAGAWRMNLLLVVTLPLAGALIAAQLCGWQSSRHVPAAAIWAYVAMVVLYTVARNLPWHPFTLLAPR